MAQKPLSPALTQTFFDSCAFDPKYEPEHGAANEAYKICEEEDYLVTLAHSTLKEIGHPNTLQWVKLKASLHVHTVEVDLTSSERLLLRQIKTILAGTGKVENIAQDAMHIFEAQKYGAHFVTTDGRILKHRDDLRKLCGIYIFKPTEFLQLVKDTRSMKAR